ncbi:MULTISPECIES: LacI family DNA-binding transcriptional regulator [Bifidobacterium]|nr:MULTISPECIES: LacI family DNA-binding transcriptional regulator [Bifidobacterium]
MVKPTMEDIARAAHVSVSTVSRALADHGGTAAGTKRLVHQVAVQLGYTPGDKGRAKTWHSGMVGLITTDLEGRPSLPVLIGAEDALGPMKHSILLANSRGDARLETSRIEQLMSRNIDGLLVVNKSVDPRSPIPRSLIGDTPVVYVYGPSRDPDDCSVTADSRQGAELAISHLIDRGRRRIAVIGGPEHARATSERMIGVKHAFAMHGLRPVAPPRFGSWDVSWGRKATELLLQDDMPFDGLYCLNDRIARGALETLMGHGLHVPDDVAVIGHDNWERQIVDAAVPLTTVDSDCERIGRVAAMALLDAIQGNPHHGMITVSGNLIQRASTSSTALPKKRHPRRRSTRWADGER